MIARVQIRPEVVAGDDSVTGSLNIEHPLSGDTVVYPFGDRLWRHADRSGELRLRADDSENGGQNAIAHETPLIHGQFMSVNNQVIAHHPMVDEHAGMRNEIPQPENYASFKAWIIALCDCAPSQAALAKAVGVKPQMITKYRNGRSIEPENLQKFADYTGVSYAKLRLLVDGKSVSDARQIKDRINQTATPMGAQIGRKWEAIHDEGTRTLIAQQIENAIEQQKRLEIATRKRAG
jgi:transcriptional regulator with XRE-family HTH domain